MRNYLAFIHKDANSDYTVTFPDFPGCITAGSTLDEARAMAQEALPFHLEGLLEDGGDPRRSKCSWKRPWRWIRATDARWPS